MNRDRKEVLLIDAEVYQDGMMSTVRFDLLRALRRAMQSPEAKSGRAGGTASR